VLVKQNRLDYYEHLRINADFADDYSITVNPYPDNLQSISPVIYWADSNDHTKVFNLDFSQRYSCNVFNAPVCNSYGIEYVRVDYRVDSYNYFDVGVHDVSALMANVDSGFSGAEWRIMSSLYQPGYAVPTALDSGTVTGGVLTGGSGFSGSFGGTGTYVFDPNAKTLTITAGGINGIVLMYLQLIVPQYSTTESKTGLWYDLELVNSSGSVVYNRHRNTGLYDVAAFFRGRFGGASEEIPESINEFTGTANPINTNSVQASGIKMTIKGQNQGGNYYGSPSEAYSYAYGYTGTITFPSKLHLDLVKL
jgi:hypothetical protein